MNQRQLGRDGPLVSAIGLGAWGMSGDYGPADDRESVQTIHHAIDLGISHIDTANEYGFGHNEELIGKAIRDRRDDVFLATKFGMVEREDGAVGVGGRRVGVSGRPEHIHHAIAGSLKRLQTDRIDLYYQHRVDPETPIEETVGAMAELVAAGKVRYLGLSEASVETIRRANAVHQISALQSEYSLWTREPEREIIPALRELGIALVPFSPLGRGFLAGGVTSRNDLAEGDFRAQVPRFSDENLEHNLKLLDELEEVANEKGVPPAQIALAWLLEQGNDILPIPGMRRRRHVDANSGAVDVSLDAAEMRRLEAVFSPDAASGERYPQHLMRFIDE